MRISVVGVLLIVAAIILAWAATNAPPTHLVRVYADGAFELCGELGSADRRQVVIRTEQGGSGGVALPADLWRLVESGRDAIRELPDDLDLDVAALYVTAAVGSGADPLLVVCAMAVRSLDR